ncbi:MAG TPA: cytochrome P460 family protein [Edaphobacter sp.]
MKHLLLAAALFALIGCNTTKPEPASINQQATLAGQLPYNPLAWRVVTSWTNQNSHTMSTLYGNDLAVEYARTNAGHEYPAGAVLALVTWQQRDDPHWFGARIPGAPQTVEFVTISSPGQSPAYERYQGSPLIRTTTSDPTATAQRVEYLLSQRAAVMP